jgi:hypothetical protein
MQRVSLLLLVLAGLWPARPAAGWYTNLMGRTNYTNATAAFEAAIALDTPLWVSDDDVIRDNDTIPTITTRLTLVGESAAVRVSVETPQTPAFLVTGTGELEVSGIDFVFNYTLFEVQDDGVLTVAEVGAWFGDKAVVLRGTGAPGTGFVGSYFRAEYPGIAIRQYSGAIAVVGVFITGARTGGLVVSIEPLVDVSMEHVRFVDTLTPIGLLAIDAGDPSLVTPSNDLILTQDWSNSFSIPIMPAASTGNATFGGGGGSGAQKTSWSTPQIVIGILLGVTAALLFILIIAVNR